jgi:hypothetical protein
MKQTLIFVAALILAACAPPKKEVAVNLAGYSPAFRTGYGDGCASSNRTGGQIRDEDRFKHDSQYALGWRDGFDICARKKK